MEDVCLLTFSDLTGLSEDPYDGPQDAISVPHQLKGRMPEEGMGGPVLDIIHLVLWGYQDRWEAGKH